MSSWQKSGTVIFADIIFLIAGAEENLIDKLSQDGRERIAIAISSFTALNNQVIHGNVKISLLKIILERKDAFLELLKIGNNNNQISQHLMINDVFFIQHDAL